MVRGLITWVGIAAVLTAAGTCARAETLTISLEEPALAGPVSSNTKAEIKAPAKTDPLPKEVTVKVGRVGMVQVKSAPIYKSKSSTAAKFATVGMDTPLAVVKEEDGWYGVLMSNGAVGWVAAKNVKMTSYDLLSKKDKTANPANAPSGESWRESLTRTALQYDNIRYVYGGTDPSTGMDCSAFVRMIFSQYSINLPRTAREQALVGTTVPLDQLQPGDRLYFSCNNPYIDHCGIYTGNYLFVHCSSSKKGVSVDSLLSDFYGRSLVVAKRS